MINNQDFFKEKRVLVTGASGLIGSHLLIALQKTGALIRASIHDKPAQVTYQDVEYIKGDLIRKEDCKRVVKDMDYVFHCAAQSFGAKIMKEDPKCLVTPNIIMNANLLDSSSEEGVKKFLFISSNTVYPVLDRPVKENDANGDFFELYVGVATVKYFTEKLCEFYSKKYPMKCIVVRPANFYGEYDKFGEGSHVIPALIQRALKKEDPFIVWGTGENIKDFMYAGDVAEYMLNCLEMGISPINIGSGKGYLVKEIVQTILELTNFKGRVEYDPTKPDAIKYRVLESKFKENTSLREGLKKTIDWYNSLTYSNIK
ncbi:NAD-dependent epimerase/dehydratase family protein [Candidatus Pacearchaeota archaeon]|nr:NAD-dependent epimerase/dehydratase family protein [Candidatus Pacearchaeota archaeon]